MCEGRSNELRNSTAAASPQPEFLPPGSAEAKAVAVPVAEVMEGRDGDGWLFDGGGSEKPNPLGSEGGRGAEGNNKQATTANSSSGGGEKKGKGAPKAAYLVGGIAIGTAVGVAAAVAMFGPGDLSLSGMTSDVFGAGVDFGHLVVFKERGRESDPLFFLKASATITHHPNLHQESPPSPLTPHSTRHHHHRSPLTALTHRSHQTPSQTPPFTHTTHNVLSRAQRCRLTAAAAWTASASAPPLAKAAETATTSCSRYV